MKLLPFYTILLLLPTQLLSQMILPVRLTVNAGPIVSSQLTISKRDGGIVLALEGRNGDYSIQGEGIGKLGAALRSSITFSSDGIEQNKQTLFFQKFRVWIIQYMYWESNNAPTNRIILSDSTDVLELDIDNKFIPSLSRFILDRRSIANSIRHDTLDEKSDDSGVKASTKEPAEFVPVEKQPMPITQVIPEYPDSARRAGIEGTVWVKVLIGEDGTARKAVVMKSDAEIFNESAIKAALQMIFSPAISKGAPIAVWAAMPFRFKINK